MTVNLLDELKIETPIEADRFAATIKDLIDALKASFREKRNFAPLILLYAEMDFISSLSRPKSQDDTDPSVFKTWIDRYMLPNSQLNCNSEDIYATRCGILHTLSVSSRNSRRGIAKELGYVERPDQVQPFQDMAASQGREVKVISMPDYLKAFYRGIYLFLEQIQTDPDLRANVCHHFASVPAVAYFPSIPVKK